MHILNAPQEFQDVLNKANTPFISSKILMYFEGFDITSYVGKKLQYDTNSIKEQCFDVTSSLLNVNVVLNKSIPELPTQSGSGTINQYSNLRLQLSKQYGDYFQLLGLGGGLANIRSISFEIYAKCGENIEYLVFTGKVNTIPVETFDSVTFEVRSSLWDIVTKPLSTNQYGTLAIYNPFSATVDESLNSYIAQTSPFQNITFHTPVVFFNELGQSRFLFEDTDSSIVNAISVTFTDTNNIPLGKYTLKWLSAQSVELVSPNMPRLVINHAPIITSGVLDIMIPNDYADVLGIRKISVNINTNTVGTPFSDIKGKVVVFYCAYSVEGNPISIALDLILRCITGNWYSTSAPSLDASLPIDYDSFLKYEEIFKDDYLFVTEFNSENKVFRTNGTPLQTKNIIQKVLDHVGCQLTYNTKGQISINSNWFRNENDYLWRLGSNHCGKDTLAFASDSHETIPTPEIKKMILRYAQNGFTKEYGASKVEYTPDALIGLDDNIQLNTIEIEFPYFKMFTNSVSFEKIAQYIWKCVQLSHIRIKANVLPQFGLLLDTGDKFLADFRTSPIFPNTEKQIGYVFMIYKINNNIGGLNSIECICVPEPIYPSKWCYARWCTENAIWS